MLDELEILIRLALSLFLGLLIGMDRELKHKPLGLKTCMIICVASCMVTIVSIESFHKFATPTYHAMDPMRLTAQIVSGVGFLGAGVILRRHNDIISGLTSAAVIWAASGLGIAVGAGFYLLPILAIILMILALNVIPPLIKFIGPAALRQRDVVVKIVTEPTLDITELVKAIESEGEKLDQDKDGHISIRNLKLKDLESGNQKIDLKLSIPEKQYTTDFYYLIKKINHVISVEIEH